ncbi:MAG: hypothetical protein IPJ98_00510 [Bryobacterales bacterium]|nr:hypothetical protein [Bryobacterales bacterium]
MDEDRADGFTGRTDRALSAAGTIGRREAATPKAARKQIRVVESGSGVVGVNPDQPYRPMPLNRVQPRASIFEFYLRALNPSQVRWGDVIDARLALLKEQSVGNPYFRLCAIQMAAILALMLACWLWWDKLQQVKWVAAACLADAINAKRVADGRAFAAIDKYNRHMDACNRVIESEQSGTPASASRWKQELLESQRELAQSKSEVARLREELAKRDELMNSLSVRVTEMENQLARKATENAAAVARLQRAETQLGKSKPRNGGAKS